MALTAPSIGYLLRAFPRLSQTFVLNEILALERLGYQVTVFALNVAAADPDIDVPDAARRKLVHIRDNGGESLAALWWLLRRHSLRLNGVLAKLMAARNQRLWHDLIKAAQVARLVERAGLKHLHAHLRRSTDVAWLVHRLTGVGFSFTAHSGNVYVADMARHIGPELADAEFAVTVCEYNKLLLGSRAPGAVDKIHVIHPFLSADLIQRPPPRETTKPESPLRLISVSRLVPKKGAHALIEAIHRLRKRFVPIKLTIVGEGRERARLEAMIAELSLTAYVALVGAKQPAEVHALMAASDCFVLASVPAPDGDADATPTVLGEAMAIGLPVISTRLTGIPEIVPEGAGFLVPPGDSAAIAEAIHEITTMSAERYEAMGNCGRRFVEEHWNGDKDVHRLAALFRHALESQYLIKRR